MSHSQHYQCRNEALNLNAKFLKIQVEMEWVDLWQLL